MEAIAVGVCAILATTLIIGGLLNVISTRIKLAKYRDGEHLSVHTRIVNTEAVFAVWWILLAAGAMGIEAAIRNDYAKWTILTLMIVLAIYALIRVVRTLFRDTQDTLRRYGVTVLRREAVGREIGPVQVLPKLAVSRIDDQAGDD